MRASRYVYGRKDRWLLYRAVIVKQLIKKNLHVPIDQQIAHISPNPSTWTRCEISHVQCLNMSNLTRRNEKNGSEKDDHRHRHHDATSS